VFNDSDDGDDDDDESIEVIRSIEKGNKPVDVLHIKQHLPSKVN
jgi:hypothetical protein